MAERASIQCGMPIRGPRGERLGRVLGCTDREIIAWKSPLRRTRFAIDYADVASLRRGLLWLERGEEALHPPTSEGPLQRVRPLNPTNPLPVQGGG
jgi:hypothetical protein